MSTPDNDWQVRRGTDVLDAAGTHVGRVDDIRGGYLVLRRGRFFVSDSYIPFAAIGSHDDQTIHLNVVADDEALEIWHQQPASLLERNESTSAENVTLDAETQLEQLTDREGNVRLPIRTENLVATARPVTRGVVRIETHLFTDDITQQAPGSMNQFHMQRRVVGTTAAGHDIVMDGGTFEIPFFGEDIDVGRQVRVTEEIVIARDAVETVRRVSGTVRTSDVSVRQDGIDAHHRGDAGLPPENP